MAVGRRAGYSASRIPNPLSDTARRHASQIRPPACAHSEYSLVGGVTRIKPLVKRVAELDMPAVALTDQSNMFALVRFYKAAIAAGVKPIAGRRLDAIRTTQTNRIA